MITYYIQCLLNYSYIESPKMICSYLKCSFLKPHTYHLIYIETYFIFLVITVLTFPKLHVTFNNIYNNFFVCVVIHSLQQHQRLKFQSSVLLLHSFISLCYWELEAWCECEGGNDEMLINMETVKGRDITLDKKPQRGPL